MNAIGKMNLDWGRLLRRIVLAWLAAAAAGLLLLPVRLSAPTLSHKAASLSVAGTVFAAVLFGLSLLGRRHDTARAERWGIFSLWGGLLLLSASAGAGSAVLLVSGGILLILLVYALGGRSDRPAPPLPEAGRGPLWPLLTALLSGGIFAGLAFWGLTRVWGFSASTYDFGIFAQMFHKMSLTGLPLTTLERDGLLSHFAVHLSPIWYLLLPVWMLWPRPELLPVLQAAVLVSSVLPLWLLGKRLGFAPWLRFLACLVLLVHPMFSGGTAYDIHENCFLTPLLFWLFLAVEEKRLGRTLLLTLLVLAVKEDAAVYIAVLGLYLLARGLLERIRWDAVAGLWLTAGALAWFVCATWILRTWGEGVMDYRYSGLMDPAHPGLGSAVQTLLTEPIRVLEIMTEPDKLRYAARTLLPLLGLPLLTRKQERYLLLLPYAVYHLLPSYPYQYQLLFQYGFGSVAFVFYLMLLNLRELLPILKKPLRALPLLGAAAACCFVLRAQVVPDATVFAERWADNRESWAMTRELLDQVPGDATVTATTFLTPGLYDRATVYDLQYTTDEHLFTSDYVVLQPMYASAFRRWDSFDGANDGLARLLALLEEEGYRLQTDESPWVMIYTNTTLP